MGNVNIAGLTAYFGVVSVSDRRGTVVGCPPEIVLHRLALYRFAKRRRAPGRAIVCRGAAGGRAILITYGGSGGRSLHDEIQEAVEPPWCGVYLLYAGIALTHHTHCSWSLYCHLLMQFSTAVRYRYVTPASA